jgi:hypothetical protein
LFKYVAGSKDYGELRTPSTYGWGMAVSGHPPAIARRDQVIVPRHQLGSAPEGSTKTTIGVAACAAESISGAVGLVTEQVDVQEVQAETTATGATLAPDAAISTTAASTAGAEQRHHGTSR